MPKKQTEQIMETLMSNMVQRPSLLAQAKDKDMNKKIEKIFELDVFQRMVEGSEQSTFLSDLNNT